MTHKRHILHSQQYDRPALEQLFTATDEMIRIFEDLRLRETLRKILVGRMMYAFSMNRPLGRAFHSATLRNISA